MCNVHYTQNDSINFDIWELKTEDRNKLPISEMWTPRRENDDQNDKAPVKSSTENDSDAKGVLIQSYLVDIILLCLKLVCILYLHSMHVAELNESNCKALSLRI